MAKGVAYLALDLLVKLTGQVVVVREFDSFKRQKVPQSLSGLYFFAKILLNNIAYYYVP
ncbi:Uncharacterised protein [Alloiococcus otitis]|uniref:Uncharacterized protein n=1 Tax=Alloiococcus otitis ATCC 51267 TaxID=883081 RepID=K9ESU7_9LACT|nr:hypothetical protein HMPREF9698_00344 [Alloiococcus otitis ATCC 51267]SUU81054.1 Uncharacterised protein [Alloiococcus otitis]